MRILIVEDDKEISGFLKSSLKAECFVVDIASDGERGGFMALTNDYDLIILDNMLPKKEGLEVCREVRKKKNIPIMMLSVKSEIPTKVELLEAGADDYLTKPFSFEELLARIYAILRRPRKVEDEVLKIGNLVIDTKENIVTTKKKEEIKLTRKEFMLLELLARNRKRIVSRTKILEHVWDAEANPFSNTIEAHIRSLRRKIDPKKTDNLIKTVSGMGYKIED